MAWKDLKQKEVAELWGSVDWSGLPEWEFYKSISKRLKELNKEKHNAM
jgi:hypothetical protein